MYRNLALSELVALRTPGTTRKSAVRGAEEYDSRFGSWHARASVRSKPRRELGSPGRDVLYFPPELMPPVSHPLVLATGPGGVERVLVHRLLQYLHFTSELEDLAVIPVASKISRGRAGLELPDSMRADAFKIITDEAWHAQFSFDLMDQVQRKTGIVARLPRLAPFVERLDEIRDRLDPQIRGAETLLFAIVSETLISSILADIPHDARLPAPVRALVADHAEDEGRHHAYFRSVLNYFWPALSAPQRRLLGPAVPAAIFAFLEPDYRGIGFALRDVGLSVSEIEAVIAECYPRQKVQYDVATAACSLVRYLRDVGVLDDPATADAFATCGLVELG
jgi:hypothetical protein